MPRLAALIAAARRAPASARLARLDPWPTAVLVALGLLPGLTLGTLALRSPPATALLLLALPPVVWWQGGRVRLRREEGAPGQVAAPPVPVPEPAPAPAPSASLPEPPAPPPPLPPALVHDPLIDVMELPGGTFRMGSDQDDQAYDDERPSREVRLGPFAMARTPITRGLYRSAIDDYYPTHWQSGNMDNTLPANDRSWDDAVRFCNALSQRSGRSPCYQLTGTGWQCDWTADGYRLPTEAEWEYACRAGTTTPWFWGADQGQAGRYAWFSGNSEGPQPVAGKEANPWGFHDLAGNCWEWCWDWYAPYDPQAVDNPSGPVIGWWRVLRGGSFVGEPRYLRSPVRDGDAPEVRAVGIGFRCVRAAGRQPVA